MAPPQPSHQPAYDGVQPEDFDPPPGMRTFRLQVVKGSGGRPGERLTREIGSYSPDVLEWAIRCMTAELERKRIEAETVRSMRRAVTRTGRLIAVSVEPVQLALL